MKDSKPHFNVTAALICKKGRVLIARRPAGSHLEGLWEFPGGKQEKGEGLKDCLEREIMEELGIEVKADKAILKVDHEYEAKHISLYFFSCTLVDDAPGVKISEDAVWVRPRDLKSFVFSPPDKEVIRFVFSARNISKKEDCPSKSAVS